MSELTSGTWTKDQELAITLTGNNVLVSAAAGAGKTSVLVERVIRMVLAPQEPLDLERLLVVTFTEKAAAEMKQRVRSSLEAAVRESGGAPGVIRQLALLDRAQISTIHAFCLRILRRYFFRVDLDPSFRVLDANEAELLRLDSVAELFEDLYDDRTSYGEVFRDIVERFGGRGIDEGLQSTLLSLHSFARAQPSIEEFFAVAKSQAAGTGMVWLKCLAERAVADVERALSLAKEAEAVCMAPDGPSAYLDAIRSDMTLFSEVEGLLKKLLEAAEAEATVPNAGWVSVTSAGEAVASKMSSVSYSRLSPAKNCDPSLKAEAADLRDLAKKAFGVVGNYAFMRPLGEVRKELAEVAPLVACLCDMAVDLDRRHASKKRDRGGVDFSDLERYCLEILEKDGGKLAADVQKEFDCVLVDEYQDTNPLQERILNLVSRQGENSGNIFMVGDLKQSIYRFRSAEPRLFLEKFRSYESPGIESCRRAAGTRIDLVHNFRSRAEVLDAVNAIFGDIMRERVADIDYEKGHILRLGATYPPGNERFQSEVHLVERLAVPGSVSYSGEGEVSDVAEPGESTGGDDVLECEALEKEALVAASRIRELVDPGSPLILWDTKSKTSRPCSYRDIAILMRSTKGRANTVVEVLSRCGIPCYADTGTGYFQAREVEVAIALLSIIDNPMQDIPLAAVLRSALVGLEPKDLAVIRSYEKRGLFYEAVKSLANEVEVSRASESGRSDKDSSQVSQIREALRRFLADLERWRTLARRRPLAEVLWNILTETGYHDYVGGLPGGGQRQANLRALCDRAREFDSFGRHGLFRFLKFIEKLQDSQGDLGTARALGEHEDVVRLMSVHKAKGLEFPVVFVMDLGKKFNKDDIRQDILLHRDLGVGAMYMDLETRVKYPTALYQAIAARIGQENLAEEMRVLYVALTRAREKLIMVGSVRHLEKRVWRWRRPDASNADTYLDWICPVAFGQSNEGGHLAVKVWGTGDENPVPAPSEGPSSDSDLDWADICKLLPPPPSDPAVYEEIRRRLEWRYPLSAFTTMQAKMSVGELKRRMEDGEETWRFLPRPTRRMGMEEGKNYSSAVERGIAVHALLSRIELERTHSSEAIGAECLRLMEGGFIQSPGVQPDDIVRVAAFFSSPAGIALREHTGRVFRELPFTMKVPASIFVGGPNPDSSASGDTVVVQGVIDVLLDEPNGLTILDYKTDEVSASDISPRVIAYTPQVSLYALAASRIFGKPVKKASIIFLGLDREVEVDWMAYLSARGIRSVDERGS